MPQNTLPKELNIGARVCRDLVLDTAQVRVIDEAARTVELAFSSEAPVERWWGTEILDHSPKSVDLKRLKRGGPLLMDHDRRDHVGVIESVRIDADRVGRAVVRFGKGARASEVFQDVIDGIRTNVSVGYSIDEVILESEKDGQSTYRIKSWTPHEVSLVSIPADISVGVGREADDTTEPDPAAAPTAPAANPIPATTGARTMPDEIKNGPSAEDLQRAAEAAARNATDGERKRVGDIAAIAQQYRKYDLNDLAMAAIREGMSVDEFRAKAMDKITTAPKPTAEIGMDQREVRQYSFLRAMNFLLNPRDQRAAEAAAFELECSRAAAERSGKTAQGLIVPFDVLKRDLTVGTATAGGHLVATNLLSASFIDLLRNAMVLDKLGTQFLTGLVGNIAIPRQTGGATAYWVTEGNAPTESAQAFDQVTMSPKTVGAFTDISRKLLQQSSIDVEAFVQRDLARTLGLAIEAAAINGGGSNEPVGILATSGIGDVAGGTNGLAPTWGNIIELETDVAASNADIGSLAYLTNAKVRGKLKATSKVSGQNGFIWDAGDAPLNGYRAAVTNAVPSNLTKGTSTGVCSGIIFGNFADLLIGMWGGLDLTVDPYTNSTSGTVRVVALQDVDVAVRHKESFSAMKDALTV